MGPFHSERACEEVLEDLRRPTQNAFMTIYTTNRVRFASGDDVLVGDLHRPVETSEPFDGAVVVVTGSWTTSKEQQADFYARGRGDQ
mgnify:FL=1